MFGKPQSTTTAQAKTIVDQPEIRSIAAAAKTIDEVKTSELPKTAIVAKKSPSAKNIASQFSFNSSFIFLTFLLIALIMDMYVAGKLRIIRITGKNFAHLIFIGFIFIGLFIIIRGSIL